jgi:hypothetical protein
VELPVTGTVSVHMPWKCSSLTLNGRHCYVSVAQQYNKDSRHCRVSDGAANVDVANRAVNTSRNMSSEGFLTTGNWSSCRCYIDSRGLACCCLHLWHDLALSCDGVACVYLCCSLRNNVAIMHDNCNSPTGTVDYDDWRQVRANIAQLV